MGVCYQNLYGILLEQISIPPTVIALMPKYTPTNDGALGPPLVPTHDRFVHESDLIVICALVVALLPNAEIVPCVVLIPTARRSHGIKHEVVYNNMLGCA